MRLKKILFMGQKLGRDLMALRQKRKLQLEVQQAQLGEYYFVFAEDLKQLNRLITDFDENGVPLNRAYVDVEENEIHYYPISIGQYGLAVFHSYLTTQSAQKRDQFLKIADWFVHNVEQSEQLGGYWPTYIPKPEFNLAKGWKSAFAQGRGVSICLRAWQLTGEKKYLAVARESLKVFTLDIAQGGVAVRRIPDQVFYEEYVADVPTRVLDGHIFALFGLFDYARQGAEVPGAKLAAQLFEEGITGLKNLLPAYELGYWLRFSLCEQPGYPIDDPCTIGYLKLIIDQFTVLSAMTGDALFKEKAIEYQRLLGLANIAKMYRAKFTSLKKLNRL